MENNFYADHFLKLISYYRSEKASISYSDLKRLDKTSSDALLKTTKIKKYFKVNLLIYTLMPNHFHLLIMQNQEGGIIKFYSDIINSLTRSFNLKHDRGGPIFLQNFKSKMIVNDESLTHESRYAHLNPLTGGVVKNLEDLRNYKWSSYGAYIGDIDNDLADTKPVLELFNFDKKRYRNFVESNAGYQKFLERIKKREKKRRRKMRIKFT